MTTRATTTSGVALNFSTAVAGSGGGYTRAQRQGLADEALIKVKESAVRKILVNVISTINVVDSYEPSKIGEKNNFFNFIGGWQNNVNSLRQHAMSYHMHPVFDYIEVVASFTPAYTPPPSPGGTVAARVPDTTTYTVNEIGSLFDLWHNFTPEQVLESIRQYAEHGEDIDRQNLQWSWEFILNNLDQELRYYVMSEVSGFPAHLGQTGPMAFYIVARKMLASSQNLTHNIVSSVMRLRLKHFNGENVTECIFVLRNILKFLNHGNAQYDRCPPTIMDNIFDVFLGCSNQQFVAYVQNLRDFHLSTVNTPEALFGKVQTYYHGIISKPGATWLIEKKKKSYNMAESDLDHSGPNDINPMVNAVENAKAEDIPALIKALKEMVQGIASSKKKSNRDDNVDRNPPKAGEPKTRTNPKTGKEEHWCGRCINGGRWGNHLDEGHDDWYRDFKASMEEKKRKKREAQSSTTPATEGAGQAPESMSRANVVQRTNSTVSNFVARSHDYVSFLDSSDDEA